MHKIDKSSARVALYLRLSKEDLIKEDSTSRSESIKNQELMLKNYALEQGWVIVGIYDDEDFSGSDRYRPNFNKMLAECEAGNVDIVLVKSQARFARDVELIEKYVHEKFKEWQVRFVTYLERIDNTKKETKKTSQITAMTDEWYLEDTSENIRATLKGKKQAGLYTGAFAPYGYLKDPDDKNHLLIDPIAAEVVKKIYNFYLSGMGFYKIVNYLNELRISCPYDYKQKNGLKIGSPSAKKRRSINCISKKGNYIITNIIKNTIPESQNDIILISMLSKNKSYSRLPTNIKLYIRNIDSEINLFSSNIFPSDNIKKLPALKKGDIVPSDTVCLIAKIKNLKRLKTIKYELEVQVNFNSKYPNFFYFNQIYCSNKQNIENIILYEKKASWSEKTIKEILTNENYIGSSVQGKFQNLSYKNNHKIHLPKAKWIVVKNTHDAIISPQVWSSVQARILNNQRVDTLSGTLNIFSKKVYCSMCNKRFEKNVCKKNYYLICSDKRTKWLNCDNKKSLRYDTLTQTVLYNLNKLIEKYKDDTILNKLNTEKLQHNLYENQIKALKKELKENEITLNLKEKYFQQLYEDRFHKIITETQYTSLSQKYNEELTILQERQVNIKNEIAELYNKQTKLQNTQALFKKYQKLDNLNLIIINEWLNKIYVGPQYLDSREIKIIWNF